jgi:Uma2 family endonuclease
MMANEPAQPEFTYEEYKRLSDDQRYEVLEGELVELPTPPCLHQLILGNLLLPLAVFTRERDLGALLIPTDVILSERTVLQPDLFFVARDRESIMDLDGGVHGPPDLVIEVLSSATAERDLGIKREIYSKYGVREYWIVDPEAKSIEVLTPQGARLETWKQFQTDSLLTSPLLPGLRIDVAKIFDY